MCQSKAEGGQRCAAHTGEAVLKALENLQQVRNHSRSTQRGKAKAYLDFVDAVREHGTTEKGYQQLMTRAVGEDNGSDEDLVSRALTLVPAERAREFAVRGLAVRISKKKMRDHLKAASPDANHRNTVVEQVPGNGLTPEYQLEVRDQDGNLDSTDWNPAVVTYSSANQVVGVTHYKHGVPENRFGYPAEFKASHAQNTFSFISYNNGIPRASDLPGENPAVQTFSRNAEDGTYSLASVVFNDEKGKPCDQRSGGPSAITYNPDGSVYSFQWAEGLVQHFTVGQHASYVVPEEKAVVTYGLWGEGNEFRRVERTVDGKLQNGNDGTPAVQIMNHWNQVVEEIYAVDGEVVPGPDDETDDENTEQESSLFWHYNLNPADYPIRKAM